MERYRKNLSRGKELERLGAQMQALQDQAPLAEQEQRERAWELREIKRDLRATMKRLIAEGEEHYEAEERELFLTCMQALKILFAFLSRYQVTLPSHTRQTLDDFFARPHEFLMINRMRITSDGRMRLAITQPLVQLMVFDEWAVTARSEEKILLVIVHEFFHLLSAAALTKKAVGFSDLDTRENDAIDEGFTDLFAYLALLNNKKEATHLFHANGYVSEKAIAYALIERTADYLGKSTEETFALFLQHYLNADREWFKNIVSEVLGDKYAHEMAHMRDGSSLLRLLRDAEIA